MGKKALSKTQINKILFLRKRGCSLPEIKRMTNHGYGTIFRYIQGVEIMPQFREFWQNKRKSSVFRALQQRKKAQEEAKKLIKDIKKRDRIMIAASLYWAEGAKKDFSLTNTDPSLIKTFVDCLKVLGIKKERISISLRIFEDLNKEKACKFWSKVVGVPKEKIMYIDVRNGKKRGKLPYGMCRVRVIKGGYFLKLLNAIKEIVANGMGPRSSVD